MDGRYASVEKPALGFEAGEHEIELYIHRYNGSVEHYSLHIS